MPIATKLRRSVTYLRGSCPCSCMTLYLRGLTASLDKLKILYLHYHNVYGHQTWHGGDIP